MKKKVLMLLSNGFHPDPRVYKEAKTLVKANYDVTIWCLDREENLTAKETIEGIKIKRFRVGKVKSGKIIPVVYALYKFYKKAMNIMKIEKPTFDIIHAHDFDMMLTGIKINKIIKKPLIYDMHDFYPGVVGNRLFSKILRIIDKWHYKKSSAIIIVNDKFRKLINHKKKVTIMNTPESKGAKLSKNKKEGIFYAGGLIPERDMNYVFSVLENKKIRFTIAGTGPLLKQYKNNKSSKTKLLGRITPTEVFKKTKNSYAIIALYDPKYKNNRLATPNKLFDAMKFGKPLIVSDKSVMTKIVSKYECGVTVKYGDKKDLSKKIDLLAKNYEKYSKKSFEAFKKSFSWDIMGNRLKELYEELTR